MAKSPNQKLKLLYLMRILLKKTDEKHYLSIADMISYLASYGIKAERKSIYSDLDALRLYGLDIECVKQKTTGYYIANRKFELPELKLFVDAVQAAKFITHKKSIELIRKIEDFASEHEAKLLQRQVYVVNRIKTMNESIYYNVDEIHNSINKNRKISFRYFEYTVTKERKFRRNGKRYIISPFALLWNHENYYMLGYDSDAGIMKHYRVDKMIEINMEKEMRDGVEEFKKLDVAIYSQKTFGMYAGKEETVKMEFSNHLAGVIIDRFGEVISLIPSDTEHFIISVKIAVSSQFFGWLASFGGNAKIIAPKKVAQEYIQHIQSILNQH